MSDGQVLHSSPYADQIEKYVGSLKQLSRIFLGLEEKKQTFSDEEIEQIFRRVRETACVKCEKNRSCWEERFVSTYQLGYEVLASIERCGNELNPETKHRLMQNCIRDGRFLETIQEGFRDARKNMIWTNRVARGREGCAIQMDTFAEMLRAAAKELEDSIFTDDRMEKKLTGAMKKIGVRVLYTYFFMNQEGKYEIHVTARTIKDRKVTMKEMSAAVSSAAGRRLTARADSTQTLGRQYMTIIFREDMTYYTMQGAARIGKGSSRICGDNFAMLDMPGGRRCAALSDGMGSGEDACKESTLVIELLEELLQSGFPEKAAIQLINTTLVIGREEIHYSTVDMSIFDLYTGECEIIKAGASSTFIKKKHSVEHLSSTSLPIGVMNHMEIDSVTRQLEDGDFVIMITDGILDALPTGEQDVILETIIQGSRIANPREMAEHILEQVMNWTGEEPADDMTVLAIGIWKS